MKTFIHCWFWLLTATCSIMAAEQPDLITPARFQDIVNTPCDAVPLVTQLAKVPFWTNAIVSNVMTYASGKVFQEKMSLTACTVGGKYIVFTATSKFYNQQMHSIVAFDAKASVLKTYGLFGDGHGGNTVTEGAIVSLSSGSAR